jgi:HrpA-like RNA helicase
LRQSTDKKEYKEEQIKIVVTQPRRVATIAMAKRVSLERNTILGQEVD